MPRIGQITSCNKMGFATSSDVLDFSDENVLRIMYTPFLLNMELSII